MCLAIPGKVVEVRGDRALVDFGGVRREVVLTLLDEEVKPGSYVLVHTGYAIQVLDQREAEETLKLWKEIAESMGVEL
jgi:hydrogenase expression/formation protein HypC